MVSIPCFECEIIHHDVQDKAQCNLGPDYLVMKSLLPYEWSDPLLIKETWWHSNDVHFKCSEEMMFGDDDVLKI